MEWYGISSFLPWEPAGYILVLLMMLLMPVMVLAALIMRSRWRIMKNWELHGQPKDKCVTTMAVLGTGGHTTEMTLLMQHLDRKHYRPLVFVYTNDFCRQTVEKIEESHDNSSNCVFLWISRSRKVGQSWLSTIWTTAVSVPKAVKHVIDQGPRVLLVNGPGVCIPVCLGAVLLNLVYGHTCAIVFVESFCRVRKLSLSGKLLRYVATAFCTQWPIPEAAFADCLCQESSGSSTTSESSTASPPAETSSKPHCLVTVGTTNFDSLMRILDANAAALAESLCSLDVKTATVQVGATSKFWPENLEKLPNFKVVKTLPHAEFLSEIEKAGLILGHAGAGTILEVLAKRKRLIVIPNRSLMDDHQLELCEAVDGKYCLSCSESDVVEMLKRAKSAFQKVSCSLPPHLTTNNFAVRLDTMMKWEDEMEQD